MKTAAIAAILAGALGFVAAGPARFEQATAAPPGGAAPSPCLEAPERRAVLETAFPEVDRVFRSWAQSAKVPGAAWGIVIDGELAHAGATGVRDVATAAPVDADSVFRIASMTKSFTAMAILKLRDAGRLQLDDLAERYVPELAGLAYPTRDAPRITIRHLLTHSAGFPEDNAWGDRQLDTAPERLAAWMRDGIPFSRAPGVAFEYSNYGFALLGRIVAAASGRPYRDYMDREILRPLGLSATVWDATSAPRERLANGYRREAERWIEETPLGDGAFGSMGGLYSSIRDLARCTSFHLSAWPPRDEPETGPLRRASLREMQQAGRPFDARILRSSVESPRDLSAAGYGYGLRSRADCRFDHVVSHSGGLPGYGSNMTWLPHHGVAVLCLANLTYASCGRAVDEALRVLARTGALQPRRPRPSPALEAAREAIERLLARWDDAILDRIAADNLLLDRPRDAWRSEIEALSARHGTCRHEGPIEAENALRGWWRMACQRGHLTISAALAPTAPPLVQSLELLGAMPLSDRLAAVATRLASLTAEPAVAELGLPLGPTLDAATLHVRLAAISSGWGRCEVGEVIEGDGAAKARLRFGCAHGDLEVRVEVDPEGRLTQAVFEPDPRATCVP